MLYRIFSWTALILLSLQPLSDRIPDAAESAYSPIRIEIVSADEDEGKEATSMPTDAAWLAPRLSSPPPHAPLLLTVPTTPMRTPIPTSSAMPAPAIESAAPIPAMSSQG